MKRNKKLEIKIALALPLVFFVGWIGLLSYAAHMYQEVKLPIQGYDPRDVLSGHYIQYTINWDKASCDQFPQKVCPFKEFPLVGRFYVPFVEAQQIEKLLEEGHSAEIVFAYKTGKTPIAKKLFIDQKMWRSSGVLNE